MDDFAEELNSLMGKNRNAPLGAELKTEHYKDPEVCKYYLVSICPHQLFPNTKYDMRPCPKRHDEFFEKQFKVADEKERLYYEKKFVDETIRVFEKQIASIDSKIKKTQAKVETPGGKLHTIPSEFQEKIDNIDMEIRKLLTDIKYLGEMGKIEESERLVEEVERLKTAKEDLIVLAENPVLAAKQMKVCEICGAMQAINDTEVRNQNHLEGKVHTGFAILRKELAQLRKQREILKLISSTQKEKENYNGGRRNREELPEVKEVREEREKSRKRSRKRSSREKSRYSDSKKRKKEKKKHKKSRRRSEYDRDREEYRRRRSRSRSRSRERSRR